jgi:hypothetical protein
MSKMTLRRAARSGTRDCPICHSKRALILHHFHGREVRNWDKPWNKAFICPSCHDDVHSGKRIIEAWVQTTEGKELAWHWVGEPPKYLEGVEAPLYTPPKLPDS